jgi:hypothetical protein
MKKFFFILAATFFLTNGNSTSVLPKPSVKASDVYIPIGSTGQKISLQQLSEISMNDLQTLTGKKMKFMEKIAFKSAQRKLKNNINRDGTLDKRFLKKMTKAADVTSGFHLGGFALGLLLFLIGVLIAYLINDDLKSSRVKWAWIGAAISLILIIIFAAI